VNLLGDGAKPWNAVLSSDGVSDVGTPIFCLRRGKSMWYWPIDCGCDGRSFPHDPCFDASDQRERITSTERQLEPESRAGALGKLWRVGRPEHTRTV